MKEPKHGDPAGQELSPDTERLLDDVAERYLDQLQSGETPDRHALVAAHPEIGKALDRRLALVEVMYRSRPHEKRAAVPTTRPGEAGTAPTPGESPGPTPAKETINLSKGDDPPDTIGPYKVLDVLGKGGMGIVYLADQSEPVRRRVALKLIKLGMDTEDVVGRFESERQALALMNHPGIAHVYEAGSTALGRPFFAMEYVPGLSITTYCDRNRLNTPDRLRLFEKVCDAVQHAHQNGIIHRDLKPTNILVTVPNGEPVPKIIDFGVAKATNQRLTEHDVFTEHGRIIGTPEYMSPEQADITPLEVDTRTDIYSLGVILYELLVGALPFDTKELRAGGFTEIRRKIREDEPPKPSTRISTLGEDSTVVAGRRRTDPRSLSRLLEGDLDWITMMAMEKDPARRYASASELAGDIRRHLRDEPVLAGPPKASYLIKKFVRRYKVHALAGAAVAASLLLGLLATSLMFLYASQQASVARERGDQKEKALQYLRVMLESVDPAGLGYDATVADALDVLARRIEATPLEDDEVEAELRDILGGSYRSLGLYPLAERHLGEALRIRRDHLGSRSRKTLQSMTHLGLLLRDRGEPEKAEPLYREALKAQRELFGDSDEDTISTMHYLGALLSEAGKLKEADLLLTEAREASRTVLGENHRKTLQIMGVLATLRHAERRLLEAEALFEETLRRCRTALGPTHRDTLKVMNNYGVFLNDLDRFTEAESLYRDALKVVRKDFGEDHPRTATFEFNLGVALTKLEEWEEAEKLLSHSLEIREEKHRKGHESIFWAKAGLAQFLEGRGKYSECERLLQEALQESKRERGERHRLTLIAMNNLARYHRERGEPEKALPLLRTVVRLAPGAFGEETTDVARFQGNYGKCLALVEEFQKAEEALLASLAILEKNEGDSYRSTQKVLGHIVYLYESWGKPEEAGKYRSRLSEPQAKTPR